MKPRVTTTSGKQIELTTNETFTLAFPHMVESTPESLRARVSEKSLRRILSTSRDSNERSKLERALELRIQISDHGCGRRSVQVFDGSKLVADYNL